jgi:hypothetical protein
MHEDIIPLQDSLIKYVKCLAKYFKQITFMKEMGQCTSMQHVKELRLTIHCTEQHTDRKSSAFQGMLMFLPADW